MNLSSPILNSWQHLEKRNDCFGLYLKKYIKRDSPEVQLHLEDQEVQFCLGTPVGYREKQTQLSTTDAAEMVKIYIYIFNIYISTVYSQSLLSVQDVQEVRLYLKVPGIEPQTHGIRATPHHTVHKHPEQLVALYLQEDPLVQGSLLVLEVLADPEKEEQFWSMTRCVESGRSNWQDSSSGDGYIPSHRGVLVGHHFLSYPRSTKKKRKWTEMLKRCNCRKTYILYQPVNRFHRWVKLHRS